MSGYIFLLLLINWSWMAFPLLGKASDALIDIEVVHPFSTIVSGEDFNSWVVIKNNSDQPLPLENILLASYRFRLARVVPEVEVTENFSHNHEDFRPPHLHSEFTEEWWKFSEGWEETISFHFNREKPTLFSLPPRGSHVYSGHMLEGINRDFNLSTSELIGGNFRFVLRIGEDEYVMSRPAMNKVAKLTLPLDEHPVLATVKRDDFFDHEIPVRLIEIEGVDWLFIRSRRALKVPKGAGLKFQVEGTILEISFDGVDAPPATLDLRNVYPLSGSKEIVPHLHLWESLTDKPMWYNGPPRSFFEETGLGIEETLALRWDTPADAGPARTNRDSLTGSAPGSEAMGLQDDVQQSADKGNGGGISNSIWVVLVVSLLGAAAAFGIVLTRGSTK